MLDANVIGSVSIAKMIYYGAASGVFGIILGYVIRWALTVGKKGSIEIEVKQIMLSAKEEAQKIIQESELKAEKKVEELRAQEKEKEKEWRKTEDRLVKKEENLDKKQGDLDNEVINIKAKAEEVRSIKAEIEERKLVVEKELEKVAGLSEEDAKQNLIQKIDERFEEDFR